MKSRLKQISFGLLLLILLILALATVVEQLYGREIALSKIYHSGWFVFGWAVLTLFAFIYMIRQRLYRQKAVFLLHCALGIILTGAFITYTAADRGYIHLRQGKPLNTYTLEDETTQHSLPFEIKLVLFEIDYHAGTDQPSDFISFLQIDGKMCRISMNKIHIYRHYRFYQLSYDSDEMGTVLLVYRDPWGIGVTYTGYVLSAIAMLGLLVSRIGRKGLLGMLLLAFAFWYSISRLNPMTPVLRTPMLALHVSVIMLAYLLFLFIALTSAVGLASKKQRNRFYRWNIKLLYPALFLLAAGIFIGAVWANISWGHYWGWDAKETWALITMLTYALPMHRKSLPFFSIPYKFHLYCLLAFLTVLMTFLGVSFLLGGMHSYL
ncbi:MAG: cytochrome c biogenesis protein CcsA [Dysgonamonadaceae bacterium]|jgi:ABC-type transport system involved in cytochrome c biogenesis permease subunit|nr:cytochrome c biogenesis protein CcsA [Dysgonamonadaceae bacterium]